LITGSAEGGRIKQCGHRNLTDLHLWNFIIRFQDSRSPCILPTCSIQDPVPYARRRSPPPPLAELCNAAVTIREQPHRGIGVSEYAKSHLTTTRQSEPRIPLSVKIVPNSSNIARPEIQYEIPVLAIMTILRLVAVMGYGGENSPSLRWETHSIDRTAIIPP
jgi:hypothetical protein